jgi:hypothetical protein
MIDFLHSDDNDSWMSRIQVFNPVDNVFCPTGEGGGVDATCSIGSKFTGKTVGTKEIQHSVQVEAKIAKAVGGKQLDDNEPLDVRITLPGGKEHALEVKSLLRGEKQSISVHEDALLRKVEYAKDNPESTYHTVVVDERSTFRGGEAKDCCYSGHRMYYKRGSGRYSLSKMEKVEDEAHLKRLIATPDKELPENARGSLPKGAAVKELRVKAAKASESRKLKDSTRKARLKAEGKSAYDRQTEG